MRRVTDKDAQHSPLARSARVSCRACQRAGAAAEEPADEAEAEDAAAASGASFDYLLDMALKSLTEEKVLFCWFCLPTMVCPVNTPATVSRTCRSTC